MASLLERLPDWLLEKRLPSDNEACSLAEFEETAELMARARVLRDNKYRNLITYSRKVFIPLTQLCRDVCHYCTFAQTPKKLDTPFLPLDQVLNTVKQAKEQGCKEILFTLGEKPELRYSAAREALQQLGCESTVDYLYTVAKVCIEETGLLPHINAGCLTPDELAKLRNVSASMGLMLESSSRRLCEKGMPHYGSPDKDPERRLRAIADAGEASIPFTSGILIGIGETRLERVQSLLDLRRLHRQYGHIQEVIIQNFRAKAGTRMAEAPEPDLNELLWTIAVARLIFGGEMSIQSPPNLSPGVLPQLLNAGLNDWGGVSPVTPDYVNPEAPWPHLAKLARETQIAGKHLHERLSIYPGYALEADRWLADSVRQSVLRAMDSEGYPRTDNWIAGRSEGAPEVVVEQLSSSPQARQIDTALQAITEKAIGGTLLTEPEIVRLFQARGAEFAYVCQQADQLRKHVCGDEISYVVNRNINYTNLCYFNCRFCAFSKGKTAEALRGKPYDLSHEEIARRVQEAWQRGAGEVCMQGGIHPRYDGNTYLDILKTVRVAAPDMHVHAFSPLEVTQGAQTLGLDLKTYLTELKEHGLRSLPGTAAEILDDEVRAVLCADKINTAQWLQVMETAHDVGLPTTATIMFGHVDHPRHWARHLLAIRDLQRKTGGFTEFVPLPFVADEAPLYREGKSRQGPTLREAVLMHAVARLVLHPHIRNIQTSWVKMGPGGNELALAAGANDLGGTLMNESITRAAGAQHGQEMPPEKMDAFIRYLGRKPRQRTTLYQQPEQSRIAGSYSAPSLVPLNNTPVRRAGQSGKVKAHA